MDSALKLRNLATRLWRLLAVEPTVCRGCRRPAGFLTPICEHCGAAYPVKINISPGVILSAIGSELAIMFIRLG